MLCPKCQSENAADARFCSRCGHSFAAPEAAESSGTLLKIEPGTPDPAAKGTDYKPGTPRGDAPLPAALGFAGPERRYELLEILGRGGMGSVYRARDKSLDRIVAVKRIKSGGDDESFQRFTREAQQVAKMQHPNIVTIYDFGRDSDGPYIVMELIGGETLAARLLRRGALPAPQVAGVLEGVSAAIAHAHSKGVIHRDIKPANVMIDERGVPRLLDFGLAREGTHSDVSQTGWFVGTPDYAAPEQKNDAKNVDLRADIYAIGAMLYEMLSGNRPVPLLLSKLPLQWQFIVGKACEPEPGDRYQSVAELMAAVRKVPLEATPSVPAPPRATPQNDLACPECRADNALEAGKCAKCGAPLWTRCAVCQGTRRIGMRTCNHCNCNVMVGEIAAAHRQRAEAAIATRRQRDALEELTELEFLVTRNAEILGPAGAWLPWAKAEAASARRRIEQARRLAGKARDAEQRGMLAAGARNLAGAAVLDSVYAQEYAMLATKAGLGPEQQSQQLSQAQSDSTVQSGANTVAPLARTSSHPRERLLTRASLKARCNACGVVILTRPEVIEKQKACPKCNASPFAWTPQTGG